MAVTLRVLGRRGVSLCPRWLLLGSKPSEGHVSGCREPRSRPTVARRSPEMPAPSRGTQVCVRAWSQVDGHERDAQQLKDLPHLRGLPVLPRGSCQKDVQGTRASLWAVGGHPGIQPAPRQVRVLVRPIHTAPHVGSTTVTRALASGVKGGPGPGARW